MENQHSYDYEIFRGDIPLGKVTLVPEEWDFPWVVGRIEPTDAFDVVRELSERVLELESGERSKEDLHKAYELFLQLMEPGIWVKDVDSGERRDLSGLNVEGNKVSWRWA
ncbi:hypothetical protein M1B72_21055 [Geomonas paludis]|uniref:Uncharacterized protein n=1 Tax=Geomonas paludis TaxID=2740185 RepID=A0ABY4LDP6_9BACT|nr:hypothetical protein [Geomonas paludis]UPU35899.1 hypothetical protein M1B72_21055 [Geomonas paludis]